MEPDPITGRVDDLFDQWYGALVGYATRLTGRMEVAEEIVQEAFYLLYRELRAGKAIQCDRAWTFCVVRREAIKQAYRHGDAREVPLSALGMLKEPVFASARRAESEDLDRHFGILSNREKDVVRLRLESLKYGEIADVLNISANSVATLHRRAIQKLRQLLTRPQTVKANVS